jgi:hypothetical protein
MKSAVIYIATFLGNSWNGQKWASNNFQRCGKGMRVRAHIRVMRHTHTQHTHTHNTHTHTHTHTHATTTTTRLLIMGCLKRSSTVLFNFAKLQQCAPSLLQTTGLRWVATTLSSPQHASRAETPATMPTATMKKVTSCVKTLSQRCNFMGCERMRENESS